MSTDDSPKEIRVEEIIQEIEDPEENVFPKKERVHEIIQELKKPENRLIIRLKRSGLMEGNQLKSVAHIIALAEGWKSILSNIQDDKDCAKEKSKDLMKKIRAKMKTVSKHAGTEFKKLPLEIQMTSLFRNDRTLSKILKYWKLEESVDDAKIRIARLLREGRFVTKPLEKHVNNFCRDMAALFREQDLKPNYGLIAGIVNLFIAYST